MKPLGKVWEVFDTVGTTPKNYIFDGSVRGITMVGIMVYIKFMFSILLHCIQQLMTNISKSVTRIG